MERMLIAGLFEFNDEGEMSLTAEALQWLCEGKLRAVTEPVYFPDSTMAVDFRFVGYEPCDPGVERLLEERFEKWVAQKLASTTQTCAVADLNFADGMGFLSDDCDGSFIVEAK